MPLRQDKIVPLIAPTVVGPLGIAHLPRLWLKACLNATGALADGYYPHYFGFNQRLVDALGIEPEPFFAFLATLPTYPETERYVREHAKHLLPAEIAAWNMDMVLMGRPADRAAEVRARVGLDEPTRISQQLISVDDWFTAHEWLVAHRADVLEPIVPTISSSTTGPIGIAHLPRLWMKALLTAVKALPEGWNSGFGFDARVSELIGLDLAAACSFIHAELPNYLQFEAWVRAQLGAIDDTDRLRWNLEIRQREKGDERATEERAEAGVPELAHKHVIMLNDMVDWKHLHDALTARRASGV